ILLLVVLFIALMIQGIIGLDRTLEDLYLLQANLFKGFDILDSGFVFGVFPLVIISFMLLILVQIPKVIGPFLDNRVIKYTVRRLITIIPIFIGTSMISYALMSSTGNPIDFILSGYQFPEGLEQLREQLTRIYGLDTPPQTQWLNWFFHFIMGDMGNSIYGGGAVSRQIATRIGPTLMISILPLFFTLVIAVPIGVHAAINQYSKSDNVITISVAVGLSIPIFLFILVLIILFAYYIPILPAGGMSLNYQVAEGVTWWYVRAWFDTFLGQLFSWEVWDSFFHLVIPVVAITTISLVLYVRLVRSGLLEVIRQDYILSAQAYGFPQRTIIWKHALQNVLIPIVTYIGLSIGGLLGGAPITETTLGWPGLGRFAVGQFIQYNYPMVMGIIMITAVMILLANLLTDIVYSVIDPRVSL
ncbi:MAG: ABC transporter permease, partial [Candidatus Hodarchaeales archaeon]